MNVKEAIKAIRVMLGSNEADTAVEIETTENVEVVEHNHAEATLVDGTVVMTEGDLEVGATLLVKSEEGESLAAPAGMHETTEGVIVTVGEAGKIEAIEEVAAESVEEEAAEETVEEEMSEEESKEETLEEEEPKEEFNAEELLAGIAALIEEYKEAAAKEMEEVKEELSVLTERFNVVADEPAAKTVKKSFFEEAKAAKVAEEARFDRLAAIRRGKK